MGKRFGVVVIVMLATCAALSAPTTQPATRPATRPAPATQPAVKLPGKIVYVCDGRGIMLNMWGVLRDDVESAVGRLKPGQKFNIVVYRDGAGRSTGTIAKEMGLSPAVIRGVVRRHGTRNLRAGDAIMAAIVAEMDRRGMTAYGLGQLVGSPPTLGTIYEWMRGESTPSTPVASRLLEALGLGIGPK